MLDEYQRMIREEMTRACFFEDIFKVLMQWVIGFV